jgi:hypothetical protein
MYNRYRVFASNGTGMYEVGIFPADTPQEAINDASREFIAQLRACGKPKEAQFFWVYTANLIAGDYAK